MAFASISMYCDEPLSREIKDTRRAVGGDPRYCDNVLVVGLPQSLALAGSGKCQR